MVFPFCLAIEGLVHIHAKRHKYRVKGLIKFLPVPSVTGFLVTHYSVCICRHGVQLFNGSETLPGPSRAGSSL